MLPCIKEVWFCWIVGAAEICALCLLSCWNHLVVGASLLLHWSALISWAGRVVHSSSFWTAKAIKEGTTYLLQSWHTAGFGNQARTNGHTSPSTGTKHSWQMNQPVSVCQRANHHHLPMHDIIDLAFFKLYTFLSMSKFIRTKSSQITAVPQKPPTLNST